MRRSRWPGRVAILVIVLPLACGDMRQDELDCEEAVSHLLACCPGFTGSHIECTYVAGCTTTTYPAISYLQSQCIRGESCDTLVRSGVCDRASGYYPVTTGDSDASTGPATVCP